jgi:spore coat protein U-like protein
MNKYLLSVAVVSALVGVSGAHAVTAQGNFAAKVKLNATCIVSATDLNFGTLAGLIAGTETATSTVSVKCSKSTGWTLSLDAGSGAMAGLTTATDTVAYSASLASTTGTGTGATQSVVINGTLAVQNTPSAQDYSETRTVTVTY